MEEILWQLIDDNFKYALKSTAIELFVKSILNAPGTKEKGEGAMGRGSVFFLLYSSNLGRSLR